MDSGRLKGWITKDRQSKNEDKKNKEEEVLLNQHKLEECNGVKDNMKRNLPECLEIVRIKT